jgi:general stress protein 26
MLSLAQASPSIQPERSAVISAAQEIMHEARYCTLITLGSDGAPQAREVDPFPPGDDMVVWLATNRVTRKISEITRDPRVALTCLDASGSGYVTLLGKADIVDAADEKEQHWKEEWSPFYRDKNKGEDYVLIRVKPTRLEVVSYAHRLFNDPETWAPVSIAFP